MDDYFFLGAYWSRRTMTLREYANAVKAYLQGLRDLHPAFKDLYEVGDKPNDETPLADDLNNLDELVYHRSPNEASDHDHLNPDGTLSWDSTADLGFGLRFGASKAYGEGVTIGVRAGKYFPDIPNAVTINFPRHNHPEFAAKYPDFHSYAFLKRLLTFTVNFWRPEAALIRSDSFGDKVDFEYGSDADNATWSIGWLTYLENRKVASVLPPKIEHEFLNAGGVLITITREMISATNPQHIATALLIRDTLHAKGLLRRTGYENAG